MLKLRWPARPPSAGKSHRGETRWFTQRLVETSPLRAADPRTKLALALGASLAVMLPLPRLGLFLAGYVLLVAWARLLPEVGRHLWRARWVLGLLFVVDFWLVGPELALTISLRVALLTGVFALFFSTTTPRELGLALEALRLPYRYAFSLTLALASLSLLEEEWQAIREAQAARGVQPGRGLRELWRQAGDLVAFTVPAIVLTTRRAWNATEAAYARGFDSPHRRPYQSLRLSRLDYALLGVCGAGLAVLFWGGRFLP